MTKLLANLFGGHRPDVEALSAYADGRLDAAAARGLEAHLGGCAACTECLAGLREVRASLAALPRPEAPRSFRLRQADVEAPSRAVSASGSTFGGGSFAFAPTAAAVFVVVFALILGTDLATRVGDDNGSVASLAARDDAGKDGYAERATGMAPPEAGAADATVPMPAASGALPDGEGADASGPSGDAAGGAAEDGTAAPADDDDVGTLANNMRDANEDDGARTAFLVAEIITGAAALAAVGWFVASRVRRSEGV